MFSSLQPFEAREPFTLSYQAPAIDIPDDDGGEFVNKLPAPRLLTLSPFMKWRRVAGAVDYVVESMTAGNLWTQYEVLTATTAPPNFEALDHGLEGPAFYRVRARNAVGLGEPSAVMFFAEPE